MPRRLSSLAVLLIALFLHIPAACAQFIANDLDTQTRNDPFTIDRVFSGNTPYIRFYVFENGTPFTATNWNWSFKYGTNRASASMVTIANGYTLSNRVDFVGDTNTFGQANDDWFCELIATEKTNTLHVTTWAQGRLLEFASPGAGSTTNLIFGATLNWNTITAFTGRWPVYSMDTTVLTVTESGTGVILNVISGSGTLTGWKATNGLTGGGASGTVTGQIDYAWLVTFLASNNTALASGAISNVHIATNASLDPSKILGTALTHTSVFAGAVSGLSTSLGIGASTITSSNIVDDSITTGDVTISQFDARYLNATEAPTGSVLKVGDTITGPITNAASVTFKASGGTTVVSGAAITINTYTSGAYGIVIQGPGAGGATEAAVLGNTALNFYRGATNVVFMRAASSGTSLEAVKGAVTNTVWDSGNDGSGSTLDADLLDGLSSAAFSTGTPLYVESDTNANANIGAASNALRLATGLLNTQLVANGLADTNALTLQGGIRSNLTTFAAAVSNTFGEISTNDAYDVTRTNTLPQRVLSDFNAGALLGSATVGAACTNCAMSTNMLVNGSFAAGGSFWTFSGGANSNAGSGGQLLVAGNTSGSAVQSNQFAASGGPWELSYTNTATDATGSVIVSWGGYDHVQVGALTGLQAWIVYPANTNGYLFTANVTGSTAGAWKNLTLKQIFTGTVGGVYGSFDYLNASNVTVKGSVTAGSIAQAVITGKVAETGHTMTGPLTNQTSFTVHNGGVATVILNTETNETDLCGVLHLYNEENANYVSIYSPADTVFRFRSGTTTGDLWNSINDGAGSGLDAGLVEGVDLLTNGFLKVTVAATNASAADGLALVKRGTNFSLEVPASASTGSVGGISHTGSVAGTITFGDTQTVNVNQTNDTFSWNVLGAGLSGINGAGVTGAVPAASLALLVQTGQVNQATNLPQAATIKVLASSDGGTTTYYKADDTGSATGGLFRVESQHANLIVTTNNGPTASFTLSGVATGTPLYAEANVPTNAFLPTALAVGAGDTCIVVRTGANLFSLVATSTPTTITFDSTWTTGHVGTCLIQLFAGTNSIAMPTSVIHNVGRASSTNTAISTTATTELLFQKPIGSIWRVIQLTP